MSLMRKICEIEGCGKPAAQKGIVNGKQRYRRLCSGHWRSKKGWRSVHKAVGKCNVCGWIGPCDAHRIVGGKDGGTYSKGNVISLCPNCHRMAHIGRLAAQGRLVGRNDEQKMLFKIAQ